MNSFVTQPDKKQALKQHTKELGKQTAEGLYGELQQHYEGMNKEAFIKGFVKAAISTGVDTTTAIELAKQASEGSYSWITPPMQYDMTQEYRKIPLGLLSGVGAGIGAGIGGLGAMGLERGKEKENRNYLMALLKGGLGGAAVGGGASAAIGALAQPASMSTTTIGRNLPYDPSQYGH